MIRRIPLNAKQALYVGLSRAPKASKRWLVLLPESGAGLLAGDRAELRELIGAKLAREFNYLVINKTGLRPKSKDKAEFETAFRRERRILHALKVMRRLIPRNDKIFLIGYSEGAYLAPQVALRHGGISQIVMIGGGTRGWLKEELGNALKGERTEVRRKIREIYKRPESSEKWNGFSYATWYSYRGDDTFESLRQLDLPVHALLGARDRTIDLKAALRDLRDLRRQQKPIEVHTLKNCGHSFAGHWGAVRRILQDVLRD